MCETSRLLLCSLNHPLCMLLLFAPPYLYYTCCSGISKLHLVRCFKNISRFTREFCERVDRTTRRGVANPLIRSGDPGTPPKVEMKKVPVTF